MQKIRTSIFIQTRIMCEIKISRSHFCVFLPLHFFLVLSRFLHEICSLVSYELIYDESTNDSCYLKFKCENNFYPWF